MIVFDIIKGIILLPFRIIQFVIDLITTICDSISDIIFSALGLFFAIIALGLIAFVVICVKYM